MVFGAPQPTSGWMCTGCDRWNRSTDTQCYACATKPKPRIARTLTDAEIDAFRRLPCSFNEMVQAIFTAGVREK